MTDGLSQNYANALYGMLEPGQRGEAMEALGLVLDQLHGEADFARLLSSRNLSLQEKRDVIDEVFGPRFAHIPHLVSFLKVVSDHHRIGHLDAIYTAYRSLYHADLGVLEGIAYSAERLSPEQMEAIEQGIQTRIGCKVSLRNIVDHNLLGGVKVAVDGKVFDGTLASKLQAMRSGLKGGIQS